MVNTGFNEGLKLYIIIPDVRYFINKKILYKLKFVLNSSSKDE